MLKQLLKYWHNRNVVFTEEKSVVFSVYPKICHYIIVNWIGHRPVDSVLDFNTSSNLFGQLLLP